MSLSKTAAAPSSPDAALSILTALSLSHFLNDLIQSLLPAIYPILKRDLALNFTQIGLITLAFQGLASLLQPLIGAAADQRPYPYSLVAGMGCSLVGLLFLAGVHSFGAVLAAAAVIGMGSAIFHPEASRAARLAAGGRFGFAQSFFQVGGNAGQAMGPLLAALAIAPYGQPAIAWFAIAALMGMGLLFYVGRWTAAHARARSGSHAQPAPLTPRQKIALAILLVLVISKNLYVASLQNFYTFYLIDRFGLSIEASQLYLFVFMGAIAAGVFFGGPLGDRFGRAPVIWVSVLGVLPFSLALPFVGFGGAVFLSGLIGFLMASSFPAMLVYAQELAPGRVGAISGLFFGFAFGAGALGAAYLGALADQIGLESVYRLCSFLPALGILMIFIPAKRNDA